MDLAACATPSFSGSPTTLFLTSLAAPALPAARQRAAVEVVLVLDVSLSMQGEKIELLRRTAAFLVKELSAGDHLGIVTYGAEARTALRPTAMDAAGKARAQSVIERQDRLEPATNLSGGLLRAISELHGSSGGGDGGAAVCGMELEGAAEDHDPWEPGGAGASAGARAAPTTTTGARPPSTQLRARSQQVPQPGRRHRAPTATGARAAAPVSAATRAVLLLTDGMANAGETRVAPLCALMRSSLALVRGGGGGGGATVHTFAYGRDADTTLLDALAETGSGVAYAIANVEDCALAFASCIGGLLSVVAQDLRLTLQPVLPAAAPQQGGGTAGAGEGPLPRILQVMTKFPLTELADGGVEVALKDLYAEERRDILCELPAGVGLRVRLRYANTLTSTIDTQCAAVDPPGAAAVAADDAGAAAASTDGQQRIARHYCRHLVTEAMDASRQAGDRRDLHAARAALAAVRDEVHRLCARAGLVPETDVTVAALLDTVGSCEQGMASQRAYDGETSFTMGALTRMHSLQRSNTMDMDSPHAAVYRTRRQSESMVRSPSLSGAGLPRPGNYQLPPPTRPLLHVAPRMPEPPIHQPWRVRNTSLPLPTTEVPIARAIAEPLGGAGIDHAVPVAVVAEDFVLVPPAGMQAADGVPPHGFPGLDAV
jgi:hypothetical protein